MVDMSTYALILALSAAPETERGATGIPPWQRTAARHTPRLRLNLAGLISVGYGGGFFAGGGGLSLDVGVSLFDRLAFFAHAESATTITTLSFAGGVGAEWAINETFTIGLGAGLSGATHLVFGPGPQSFLALSFPIRGQVMFLARDSGSIAREGLTLGLSVAPGVNVLQTSILSPDSSAPPFQSLGINVGITLGYSRW